MFLYSIKKKFDLKAQLNEIVRLNQPKAAEKNIEFNLDYDDNIPYLTGDPVRVHRIVLELTNNALTFTEKGSVKISAELAKKENSDVVIKLIVQDTGTGIPREDLPKLFRIDTQYTTYGTAGEAGTGLGLVLCRELIEHNGGRIWVESQVERGTTFRFTLPRPTI